MRNLKKWLKTHLQNGSIYFKHGNFPKQMYDLRDICISLGKKYQVAKIISDAQTVLSLYKYMRKFRAMGIQEIKRRNFILSLLYIVSFVIFFFFSNRVTNGWNLWENGQIFSKKNMEFQVA
jgi:hypothetical protein